MKFFGYNVLNVNSLEYVSMNNQECKLRSEIININTNEPVFYPSGIKINKCKGSCNTINDPYAKLCVPEYLYYKNCKCRNILADKLVEECSENIDRNKMLHNETLDVIPLSATPLNDYEKMCNSCTIYIISFFVFFIASIASVFFYLFSLVFQKR